MLTTATSGPSPATSTSRTLARATPGWPSSGGPDDRFVFPEEGSIIWTDNMLIPKGAQHKAAAEAMIDFVYDVENAARLALYIYYISPVKGVGDEIAETDEELAANPLPFPPADVP